MPITTPLIRHPLPAYTPFPSFLIPFLNETMRDHRRMDRFLILPFSSGCISQSSIAICENQPRRAPGEAVPSTPSQEGVTEFVGKQQHRNQQLKSSFSIAAGFQKLIKGLAQHFAQEDEEVEMEIGFPTDVQHVAHIGLDGFNSRRSWGRATEAAAAPAPELISLPSLSLRQFELAMAAAPPLPHGPPGSWPQNRKEGRETTSQRHPEEDDDDGGSRKESSLARSSTRIPKSSSSSSLLVSLDRFDCAVRVQPPDRCVIFVVQQVLEFLASSTQIPRPSFSFLLVSFQSRFLTLFLTGKGA